MKTINKVKKSVGIKEYEVWKVDIRPTDQNEDHRKRIVHVFASSAAEAESKALNLERRREKNEKIAGPVVYSTEFVLNVEGAP